MRFMNIASGSGGNATYIGSDHTHILIDTGISRKRILEGLAKLELTLNDLTAILITHEHADHVSSLALLERAREIPVYTTEGTAGMLMESGCLPPDSGILRSITADVPFSIGDLQIVAFSVSHDAAEPVCYKVVHGDKSCGVITDLGFWDDSLLHKLEGLNVMMIEANHDVRMLEAGPYPYPLKRRIAGSTGHLSNESAGRLVSSLLHENVEHIALGHLSKHNNTPELARLTVDLEIDTAEHAFHAGDFPVDVADPRLGTGIYEIYTSIL